MIPYKVMDEYKILSLSIEKKPEGAERELEEGIWASEGVEAKTGRDRSRLRMK